MWIVLLALRRPYTFVVMALLSRESPFDRALAPITFQDLGKLLLTFTMLWAYVNFSQFLIIWSGNLPEEIPWYIERMHGVWGFISVALIVVQFAAPFMLLLSRELKRNARLLRNVAIVSRVELATESQLNTGRGFGLPRSCTKKKQGSDSTRNVTAIHQNRRGRSPLPSCSGRTMRSSPGPACSFRGWRWTRCASWESWACCLPVIFSSCP